MEGAHEVRDVTEADVERDVRDRSSVAGQKARRAAEPAADQVLVGSHAEDAGEDSQEVKRAQPGLARHRLEIDGLVRVGIDPQRRVDRAAAITSRCGRVPPLRPRDHVDDAGGEPHADFVEADVAPPLDDRLGQLAEHDQLGQRCDATRQPDVGPVADRFDDRRGQVKGEALVGVGVVVRARVLVAGMADQDRAGDELERLAPGAITEAAAAHVGDREAVVNLEERLGTRGDGAAAVDH